MVGRGATGEIEISKDVEDQSAKSRVTGVGGEGGEALAGAKTESQRKTAGQYYMSR